MSTGPPHQVSGAPSTPSSSRFSENASASGSGWKIGASNKRPGAEIAWAPPGEDPGIQAAVGLPENARRGEPAHERPAHQRHHARIREGDPPERERSERRYGRWADPKPSRGQESYRADEQRQGHSQEVGRPPQPRRLLATQNARRNRLETDRRRTVARGQRPHQVEPGSRAEALPLDFDGMGATPESDELRPSAGVPQHGATVDSHLELAVSASPQAVPTAPGCAQFAPPQHRSATRSRQPLEIRSDHLDGAGCQGPERSPRVADFGREPAAAAQPGHPVEGHGREHRGEQPEMDLRASLRGGRASGGEGAKQHEPGQRGHRSRQLGKIGVDGRDPRRGQRNEKRREAEARSCGDRNSPPHGWESYTSHPPEGLTR